MGTKIAIGIDNGATGSIGVITENNVYFIPTPIKKVQDYTKRRKDISRLDTEEFKIFLKQCGVYKNNSICYIERPLVNPTRFYATESALRILEAELIVLEELEIPYIFLDSKEWQKKILPQGTKGEDLKRMSKEIGIRLYPQFREMIEKRKEADGLLIAHYGKNCC